MKFRTMAFEQKCILVQHINEGAYLLYLNYFEESPKKEFIDFKKFDAIKSFVKLKYFQEVAESQNTGIQDIEVQLFFESPDSSFKAQSFHINKQCWLTY